MFFDKERHLAVRLATWEAHMAEKEYASTIPYPHTAGAKLEGRKISCHLPISLVCPGVIDPIVGSD